MPSATEELRLMRSVFAAIDDAYCVFDVIQERGRVIDARLVEVNPRFEAVTGLRGGQLVRGLDPQIDAVWFRRLDAVVGSGEPLRTEHEWCVLGRYWDVFVGPLDPPDRLVAVFRDITTRKLTEYRERFRTELADALRTLSDPFMVQSTAARLLGEHLGAVRVFYAEPAADGRGMSVARDYVKGADSIVGTYPWEALCADAVERLQRGRTWVSDDAVYVPLAKQTGFEAAFAVYDMAPRAWSDEEVALIEEVAQRTWDAIERARAEQALRLVHEEEHRVSLGLQRALLPATVLQHPGVAIAARYEARSQLLEVGGDWYDTFTLPSGLVAIAAGDVVGNGLEAAAAMGKLRVATAALARHADGPGQLLSRLDDFTSGADGAEFATACFATFDPASGRLRFASAGHPPMLLIQPDGEARWLTGGRSGPLVRDVDPARPDASTTLAPGSLLILYSDGLIERRGEPISCGIDRLERTARTLGDASVEQACDALIEAMGVASSREDDVIVVCLRVPARILARFRRALPAHPDELRELRAALREWLAIHASERAAPALMLAVGEACANAIEHAYSAGPPGLIEVAVDQHEGGTLSVRVRDFGRWRPTSDGPASTRGKGIGIMRSVTTQFARQSDERGTIVTFTLKAS
jgi:serine phosphatase RsbU (regulator of sigma subunit)/anti-sigma regulatory factor (Ser/Thr protein kinase)